MINVDLESDCVDVTEHINKFRSFLIACWPYLTDLMEHHNWDDDGRFIGDWLQINWEILVEREILENSGALTQFSTTHLRSRVISPQHEPTHTIIAKSERNLLDPETKNAIPFEKGLRLFSFRTYKNHAFGVYPPFDFANLVLDATKELFIAPVLELRFELIRLNRIGMS